MATVVRIEKNRNYTVMSNYHLRDKSISLKAKGLLSVMLSLPDNWNYSNRGIAGIVKEGVSAVGTGLRELEAAGYIKRTPLRDEHGQITTVEYVIYEQPHKEETTGSEQSAETEGAAESEPVSENSVFFAPEENSYANEPHIENKDVVSADMENREQLNTNKTNTKKLNTDCNKYQSTNNAEPKEKALTESAKSALSMPIDWIDRYKKTTAAIKNQIDYDSLITTNNAELVNDIVSVMTEVMLVDTPYYTIEGKQIPAELVRINYRKITYSRLDTFLLDFSRLDSRINNPKSYLITALYNIASTAETSITNRVNHDMYGG